MTINKYFQQFPDHPSQESLLYEDLMIESIQVYGTNVFYIPRNSYSGEQDDLFGEVKDASFSSSFQIEMLVNTTMGPEGPGDLFSKFGLEIQDQYRFVVARRQFKKYVPDSVAIRPREGDLLWIPAFHNIMEINWCEEEVNFYQLGRRPPFFYYYDIRAEQFRHNNELFHTGIAYLDTRFSKYAYTVRFYLNDDEGNGGIYYQNEIAFEGANAEFTTASGIVKAYNLANNTIDLTQISGEFTSNTLLTGLTSMASYNVSSFDDQTFDGVDDQLSDNAQVEEENANNTPSSPTNPFSYGSL